MMDQQKNDIRAKMLNRRRTMNPDTVQKLSLAIQDKIIKSRVFDTSTIIMTYMPIKNEVRTELLIRMGLASGKTILLPRVRDAEHMEAAPILSLDSDLHPGSLHILEPDPSIPAMDPQRIDLVILPGVAFDKKGFRLGFGAGCYDRFIPRLREDCILVAPAYDFQVLDHIPSGAYDQPVDFIVTEKNILCFSSKKGPFIW